MEPAPARWTPVATSVFCPAVAARGERGLVLFWRSGGGELFCRERDAAATWGQPRSLGVPVARAGSSGSLPVDWPISACGTGDGRIHLLARGPDGELVHGTLHDDDWSGFECIGLPATGDGVPMGLAGAPSACSRERGTLDVFAAGAAGDLLQARCDASGFTEFESLGRITAAPGVHESPVPPALSACNAGSGGMAVLATGSAGDLLCKWWKGGEWGPFRSLGPPRQDDVFYPGNPRPVPLSGPPVACGGGSARLDVFARGSAGDLLHRCWNGKAWTEFLSLGVPVSGEPPAPVAFARSSFACVWGKYRLDVFGLAADGVLYGLRRA